MAGPRYEQRILYVGIAIPFLVVMDVQRAVDVSVYDVVK